MAVAAADGDGAALGRVDDRAGPPAVGAAVRRRGPPCTEGVIRKAVEGRAGSSWAGPPRSCCATTPAPSTSGSTATPTAGPAGHDPAGDERARRAEALGRNDKARTAYVRHFYAVDAASPQYYDLVIDSTRVPLKACTELIVAAVEACDRRLT